MQQASTTNLNGHGYPAMPAAYALLAMAWDDVTMIAAKAGIDAAALKHRLPAPGSLLKGAEVPVLEGRYRYTCSVLLHINRLPGGDEWPFLRFSTFQHGGMSADFNGYRWWRRPRADGIAQVGIADSAAVRSSPASREDRQRETQDRLARYQRWLGYWQEAMPLSFRHSWCIKRLAGLADASLLARLQLRVRSTFQGFTLMAPLVHAQHGHRGFQLLHVAAGGEEVKRFCLPEKGAMAGSFVHIRQALGVAGDDSPPVAICEGLATAMSLAICWPGEIRAALCAGNLGRVRADIAGPAVFFHDQDVWKPHVGNVGLDKARHAMRHGDMSVGPRFSSASLATRPTDFNDLLCLEGRAALCRQLPEAWVKQEQPRHHGDLVTGL